MKIIFLSRTSPSESRGGVFESRSGLISALSKRYSNEDFIEISIGRFAKRNKGNIKHISINGFQSTFLDTMFLTNSKIFEEINKIRPDLLICYGNTPPYNIITLYFQKNFSTAIHIHGLFFKEIKYPTTLIETILRKLIYCNIEKYMIERLKNLIVPSQYIKSLLEKRTKSKIFILPNGINFKNIEETKPFIFYSYPNLIYIGGLHYIKGLDILIQAMSLIIKVFPKIKLYILGIYRQEFLQRNYSFSKNVLSHIEFLGYIRSSKKFSYLKGADICIIPSRFETFSIVNIESIACKIPVIASDIGIFRERIIDGNSGLLFQNENSYDLAMKIILLLNDRCLSKKIIYNSQKTIEKFDWEIISKDAMNIYKEIINEKETNNCKPQFL